MRLYVILAKLPVCSCLATCCVNPHAPYVCSNGNTFMVNETDKIVLLYNATTLPISILEYGTEVEDYPTLEVARVVNQGSI